MGPDRLNGPGGARVLASPRPALDARIEAGGPGCPRITESDSGSLGGSLRPLNRFTWNFRPSAERPRPLACKRTAQLNRPRRAPSPAFAPPSSAPIPARVVEPRWPRHARTGGMSSWAMPGGSSSSLSPLFAPDARNTGIPWGRSSRCLPSLKGHPRRNGARSGRVGARVRRALRAAPSKLFERLLSFSGRPSSGWAPGTPSLGSPPRTPGEALSSASKPAEGQARNEEARAWTGTGRSAEILLTPAQVTVRRRERGAESNKTSAKGRLRLPKGRPWGWTGEESESEEHRSEPEPSVRCDRPIQRPSTSPRSTRDGAARPGPQRPGGGPALGRRRAACPKLHRGSPHGQASRA